jgi:hypothetical protein
MEPESSLPYSQVPANWPYHSRSGAFLTNETKQDAFLRWWVVSASPKPQDGGPLLVGCLWLLIQYICSYPPYWRQFLHQQPEDAPGRGGGTHLSHSRVINVKKLNNSAEQFLQFEVDKSWANQEITSFCRRKKFITDYIELSPHTFYWHI